MGKRMLALVSGAIVMVLLPLRVNAQASGTLPNVIDSCYNQSAPSKGEVCLTWVRDGDHYLEIQTDNVLNVKRFDTGGAVFSGKQAGGVNVAYSGKIASKRIEGTLEYTYDGIKLAKPVTLHWSASYADPPRGNPATGRHVYVACDTQVSIINTANHSVINVKLDGLNKVGAIAVSPESTKAYVSSDGDSFHPATLYVIDGTSGAVLRRFALKDTPAPSGFSSLAVSGSGSIVYGFGWDRSHLWSVTVAIDSATGAVRASAPLPKGHTVEGFVVSGSKVVLDDGNLVNIALENGAPPVFSSNGHGLAAFPDGTRICANGQVRSIGAGAPLGRAPGSCGAISPEGATVYVDRGEGAGVVNFLRPIGKIASGETVVGVGGLAAGVTSDGSTVYALDPGAPDGAPGHAAHPTVFTFDTASGSLTDAVPACAGPRFLGMEPLTRQIAAPAVETISPAQNPNRAVAMIAGKPITAQQATNILNAAGPPARQRYHGRLQNLVQQIYMQGQIAQEAARLHLDQKPPWKEQLASAHHGIFPLEIGPGQVAPPNLTAAWQNARSRILWNAYFGQAATPEERQVLLKQKREQYEIQVEDAGFFENWAGK